MHFSPLLLIHISGAVIGVMSGFMAMIFRKGSRWHAAAGNVFVVAMLAMSGTAAYMAVFVKPVAVNVIVGVLTFYLVSTAWWAAKRREAAGLFDIVAMLIILADGVAGIRFGIEAAQSAGGTKDGMPAAGYFAFGTVALLCAITDIRLLRRGSIIGSARIARHLWRMCLALLITTLSFYPGQARLFPQSVRGHSYVYLPHLFLVGSMLYWRFRMSRRKRAQKAEPATVTEHRVAA